MEDLSAGQVVLARFPFWISKNYKLRPCLIIAVAEFGDVIMCQITSKRYGGKKAVSLRRNDFTQGSIIIDSFIRPDKIATLDKSTIHQVLGKISDAKHNQVKTELKALLGIS